MANELRFIETLDSSNFDKGIAQSSAAVRKIAEDANLASKGLAGMFDSDAFRAAAQNFQGVEKAVQRFTAAMQRDLPIKQEMRETQLASQELERAWRALSAEEKRTAAGRELRAKIDELIARGGALRDTMGDVQAAIRFNASDTASLDAVVGGIQAMTAAAQVGAGAMQLLGMSQEDAAKVQADLMAIMSVVNGLQVIQNSLTRESALMQGIVAVQTKAAAVATSLKAATSKADTIATKVATAAQWAWNAALSANPIGAVVAAVAALAAGIYLLTRRTHEVTDAERASATALHAVADAQADAGKKTAQASLELQLYRDKVVNFNGTAEQERVLIEEINQKYGEHIGYVRDIADAKAALAENAEWYIKQLQAEAKATALASAYGDTYAKVIKGEISFSEGQESMKRLEEEWRNVIDDAQFYASMIRIANNLAGRSTTRRSTTSGTRRTTGGRSTTTTPTATKEPTPEGSWAWYDEQIQMLNDLAAKQADVDERNRLLAKAARLENVKLAKFEGAKGGGWLTQLNEQLNEQLSKVKIKIPPINLDITTPEEEANEKAKAILEKTKGLRTAAQAAASAFRSMGDAIGGNAGKMVNVAGMLAQAIVTMIQGYATATAQAGLMGPWNWIAFGLTGLGQLMAMISAVKSVGTFANGGFVGGSSYSGDRNFIRVNSGELVLNTAQQARLWNAINGGGNATGGLVNFKISGSNLVGVLRNYNNKTSKIQ